MPLAKAEKQPRHDRTFARQLAASAARRFKLGELKNNLSGEVLLPVSELIVSAVKSLSKLERLRTQTQTLATQ